MLNYSSESHVPYYNHEENFNPSGQESMSHTKSTFGGNSIDYFSLDVGKMSSLVPESNRDVERSFHQNQNRNIGQHDLEHSYLSSKRDMSNPVDNHQDSSLYYRDQPGGGRNGHQLPRDYSNSTDYSLGNNDHQDSSYSYRGRASRDSGSSQGGYHQHQQQQYHSHDNVQDGQSSYEPMSQYQQSRFSRSDSGASTGSSQSKYQFASSSSSAYLPIDSSTNTDNYNLGNQQHQSSMYTNGTNNNNQSMNGSVGNGGGDLDMSAYRRGLGMKGGGGDSMDEYSRRYERDTVPGDSSGGNVSDVGNSGGGYYDNIMGSEQDSYTTSSTGSQNTSLSSGGVSRYAGPSDSWMKERPRMAGRGAGRSGGRGGGDMRSQYNAGRTLDFHHLQLEQQQQQLHHQQYDAAPSWKYHPRSMPRQGGRVQHGGQQQHIQQVHPKSSGGYSGHNSGSNHVATPHYGGGDQFSYPSQHSQQQVLSRYMDTGGRDDQSYGSGGGGSIHSGSSAGAPKYMPRSTGYGGPGGRGGGRGGGMNGRLGHSVYSSQAQVHGHQHQHHQGYGYGGGSVCSGSSAGSYNGSYASGNRSRNDQGYDDDMSYDRSAGGDVGVGNKMMRGVPMNASATGTSRTALKTTSRSGDIVRDVELEEVIYRNTQIILSETANKRLKSVELANALRDRIGKDYLARTKTLYGGLLVLLELHRETFRVQRVPKNDMVELLIPYHGDSASTFNIGSGSSGGGASGPGSGGNMPQNSAGNTTTPQLVPEAMGLDSADIQQMQQARQLPGNGVSGGEPWDLGSAFASGQIGSPGSSTTPPGRESSTSSVEKKVLQPIQPSTCLYIREIPDDTTASQIFADFGGSSIVEKVHVNLEGTKRTGLIWFATVSGALRALSIPLSSWRPFLSFHYPSDEHNFEFLEEANASSVAELCAAMMAMSMIQRQDSDNSLSSGSKHTSSNTTPNSSGGIALSPSLRNISPSRLSQGLGPGLDVDMFNVFRDSVPPPKTSSTPAPQGASSLVSPNDDSNMLQWGEGKMKISGLSSEKPPVGSSSTSTAKRSPQSQSEDDINADNLDELPEENPELSPLTSLSERRPAPPPINTNFASDEQLLASRSPSSAISYQLTNSPNAACLSSPGTQEAFFAFKDDNAPGGICILPKDSLPAPMIEVMNTLCDVVYVPQKIWERNEAGDYPFVQVIVDILSVIFQNAFVQLTKLKQQVKKRLGGSIRIGPLKAILQAYPEHFEMDKNMTLVRSLKKELPLMNIDRVNLNLF